MNKDQVKGVAKEIAGKVRKSGQAGRKQEQQIKGDSQNRFLKEVQKGAGDIKQSIAGFNK